MILGSSPSDMPSPSVHALRAVRPGVVAAIEGRATSLNIPISRFLADLAWHGWQRSPQGAMSFVPASQLPRAKRAGK